MGALDDKIWRQKQDADHEVARRQTARRAELKTEIEKLRQRGYKALVKAKYPTSYRVFRVMYRGEDRVVWIVGQIRGWSIYLTSTGELLRDSAYRQLSPSEPVPYDAPHDGDGSAVELDNYFYEEVSGHLRMFPGNL